ncbi:MAG: hypothetical protein LBS50_02275 [Prevotellaceae bacterium]|jgi:adenine-specific DNA methylase|nr:hypothetical protein [Prevotellaceae bacterium]
MRYIRNKISILKGIKNALKIDFIRNTIEQWKNDNKIDDKKYYYLIAALLELEKKKLNAQLTATMDYGSVQITTNCLSTDKFILKMTL